MKSAIRVYATLTPVYDVEIFRNGEAVPKVTRSCDRVILLSWLRTAQALADTYTARYSRRWVYREDTVTMCAGCLARPSLWDIDGDGAYDTVSCGVCDWWTAWNQHHPEMTYAV